MAHDKIVQVALVGCGAVSQLYYTPALKELERRKFLRVKALLDPGPENLAQLRKAFPTAVAVKNLGELTGPDIDLAIIASPPRCHAEQTIQLLQAGLSVLCEKPMASSVAEGEAMIEAASAAEGLLAIGLFRRFFPATRTICEILSHDILGKIKTFYCYEGGKFGWPVRSPSYFKKTAQGGVLSDIGVHLLDLLIWWWGRPAEVIYEDDAMEGIEVNCHLKLKFAQGFAGEVRLSRDCTMPNRYVIKGEKGWLSWNVNDAAGVQIGFGNTGFTLDGRLHHTVNQSGLPLLGIPAFNFEQSFISQLSNIVAALQGLEPLVISGEQGLESLRLIEYCYHNRRLMPMPWLSEEECRRARQLTVQS